jgi:hypothetical protein
VWSCGRRRATIGVGFRFRAFMIVRWVQRLRDG